ncbi:hypothetical protein [Micromonospora craniellae]|uniref:hypothetical protein n=1 Tax=Micromonospora craniellae TaxID=2294034 RepID=UPI00168BEBDB|nr:hypothetical protein [Micromonospora craniellae]QOC95405.1 hypothetical protein ID554_15735 [Micromonospora craniellae]
MVAVTAPSRAPLAVLEAVLEQLTYVNQETGYTVARVATGRGGDLSGRRAVGRAGRGERAITTPETLRILTKLCCSPSQATAIL